MNTASLNNVLKQARELVTDNATMSTDTLNTQHIQTEIFKRVSAVLAKYDIRSHGYLQGFVNALLTAVQAPIESEEMTTTIPGITLTIPQELYVKASQLAQEMYTQDNRATRLPYYVCIREIDRVFGIDEKFSTDGYILSDPDDTERHCEPDDVPEEYEEDIDQFEEVYYREIEKFSNAFLSVKTAEKHLRLNGYHYNGSATTYIDSAWRNPDMDLVWELMKLFFVPQVTEEVQP